MSGGLEVLALKEASRTTAEMLAKIILLRTLLVEGATLCSLEWDSLARIWPEADQGTMGSREDPVDLRPTWVEITCL